MILIFILHIKGLAKQCIAIDPYNRFHSILKDKDYDVFSYVSDANDYFNQCDVVFSFDVIEHVEDPVLFLKQVKQLLAPNGELIIITPNRDEILMTLIPEIYSKHFYSTVHTWYFNRASLRNCINAASLSIENEQCIHGFGVGNAINWIKKEIPTGHSKFSEFNMTFDTFWKSYLEENWLGSCLCFTLKNN